MGLGGALRFAQYLANRSLWLDEAFLALNVVQRPFSQLLQPLDDEQVAPIAYLLAEKLAVITPGDNEYALRLFPCLAGIAALLLFYAVAKSCLAPKGLLISLVLFAVSGPLSYYSSEVKQYSSDVTVALLLYFLVLRYVERGELSGRSAVLLGTGGAIAIWFSHPAIFVLAGIGASLALLRLAKGLGRTRSTFPHRYPVDRKLCRCIFRILEQCQH
jgi:uncharacterized membrane protein